MKAIAVAPGYGNSSVASAAYIIAVPTPIFSPKAGTYTSAQSVAVTDSMSGATIYYTTDGSTPTSSSKLYTGPVVVSSSQTIKAIAVASGYGNSVVTTATYTVSAPIVILTLPPTARSSTYHVVIRGASRSISPEVRFG